MEKEKVFIKTSKGYNCNHCKAIFHNECYIVQTNDETMLKENVGVGLNEECYVKPVITSNWNGHFFKGKLKGFCLEHNDALVNLKDYKGDIVVSRTSLTNVFPLKQEIVIL